VGREQLTRTRGVVGTYEYMSPEQVMGEPVSPASDVYSLGITLYEMITGIVPFPQNTDTGIDVMNAHREKPPPQIADQRPDCPAWLADVVHMALEKAPSARYPNAGEMLAAIEAGGAEPEKRVEVSPEPPAEPPPQPVRAPAPAPEKRPEPPAEPEPESLTELHEESSHGKRKKWPYLFVLASVTAVVLYFTTFYEPSSIWRDQRTGLTWQNPPAGSKMEWSPAKQYCKDLELGGHTDWHLPTISELRSLIRGCPATEDGGSCNIKQGQCVRWFCRESSCGGCSNYGGPVDGCYWPDEMRGTCSWYWSSSPVEDYGYVAWGVGFSGGNVPSYGVYNGRHVRCVR